MTATELAKELGARAEEVCRHLLPSGSRKGRDWCAGSVNGDAGDSLKVCLEGAKAGVWADFAAGDIKGDLIGLWQSARGVGLAEACREAEEFLGVSFDSPAQAKRIISTKAPSETWVRIQERLRKGTTSEFETLATLRKIPNTAGLQLASNANQLWFADVWDDGFDHPSWIITDDSRRNAQARRMDGKLWSGIGDKKAKTIAGCEASWPIGIHGANGHDLALVEGGPDLLAAWHLVWANGHAGKVVPVAMVGASNPIHEEAVPIFSGKRVHFFPHADEAGAKAVERWCAQIPAAIPQVFSLPVKDLNDWVSSELDTSSAFAPVDPLVKKKLALLSHRVRASAPPPEPVTRLFLADKPICTSGNITTVTSKAKTGKTAALGAATAAIIAASAGTTALGLDTFKFRAANPEGHAVIVFDTEQSPFDAYQCYRRSLDRAGTQDDPAWLHHYSLVGMNAKQLHEALDLAILVALETHQGIFCLILDGVADFVNSVNDEAELNLFVTWLRDRTVKNNCPAICVIHSNEGDKAGNDSRGHLGKQLIRKAESNLMLKKSGEVTSITSDKQRKAPITEADGVSFEWSEEFQRHVSSSSSPSSGKSGRKPKYDPDQMITAVPGPNDKPEPVNIIHRKLGELPCSIDIRTFKDWMAKWIQTGEVTRSGDIKNGFFFKRTF